MQTEIMKRNLREYYNKEAPLRNLKDKAEWKISQRSDSFISTDGCRQKERFSGCNYEKKVTS